ncbi:transposase [Proteus mirabilis]|uniref:transposase n=1 Tax=Proteus mirabilis TaxID=584 RepID=UPI00358DA228
MQQCRQQQEPTEASPAFAPNRSRNPRRLRRGGCQRGVLPDKDIIKVTDTEVTFRYLDSQTNTHQTRTLPVLKFLWLILQHVLPKGMQRVRDYGFLRGNAKQTRVRIQLLLLALFYCTPHKEQPVRSKAVRACPCCDHEMACVGVSRPS